MNAARKIELLEGNLYTFALKILQRLTVAAHFVDHLHRHVRVMDIDRSMGRCDCHVVFF